MRIARDIPEELINILEKVDYNTISSKHLSLLVVSIGRYIKSKFNNALNEEVSNNVEHSISIHSDIIDLLNTVDWNLLDENDRSQFLQFVTDVINKILKDI